MLFQQGSQILAHKAHTLSTSLLQKGFKSRMGSEPRFQGPGLCLSTVLPPNLG